MSKAEKTREFIIEKTAPVFNKKGFAGTSLSDITRVTGLTKGAIYGNFKNKDDIALAVFDYNVQQVFMIASSPGDNGKSAVDRLVAIANQYKDQFAGIARNGGCPILNAAVEADDELPVLKEAVKKRIASWKDGFVQIILQGIRGGEIKKHVDPDRYASIFIALFEGGMMLSKTMGDPVYFHQSLDKMIEIVYTELKII